jgi:uncharacterized membrane protein YdjX (TVP38/TMEM64 family)
VVVVLVWLISDLVTTDWLHTLVEKLGPLGPIGVVLYVAMSHIFTPVAGSPGILLSVGLFGIWETMLLTYLGGLVSATIAFWISKRYGRKVVKHFVGEETIADIDEFIDASDEKLLVFARLFGFPMFDIISYASGLTPLSFRNYFLITAVVSAIPSFTVNYIFQFADFHSKASTLGLVGVFVVIGAVFIVVLRQYVKAYKRFKASKQEDIAVKEELQ